MPGVLSKEIRPIGPSLVSLPGGRSTRRTRLKIPRVPEALPSQVVLTPVIPRPPENTQMCPSFKSWNMIHNFNAIAKLAKAGIDGSNYSGLNDDSSDDTEEFVMDSSSFERPPMVPPGCGSYPDGNSRYQASAEKNKEAWEERLSQQQEQCSEKLTQRLSQESKIIEKIKRSVWREIQILRGMKCSCCRSKTAVVPLSMLLLNKKINEYLRELHIADNFREDFSKEDLTFSQDQRMEIEAKINEFLSQDPRLITHAVDVLAGNKHFSAIEITKTLSQKRNELMMKAGVLGDKMRRRLENIKDLRIALQQPLPRVSPFEAYIAGGDHMNDPTYEVGHIEMNLKVERSSVKYVVFEYTQRGKASIKFI